MTGILTRSEIRSPLGTSFLVPKIESYLARAKSHLSMSHYITTLADATESISFKVMKWDCSCECFQRAEPARSCSQFRKWQNINLSKLTKLLQNSILEHSDSSNILFFWCNDCWCWDLEGLCWSRKKWGILIYKIVKCQIKSFNNLYVWLRMGVLSKLATNIQEIHLASSNK